MKFMLPRKQSIASYFPSTQNSAMKSYIACNVGMLHEEAQSIEFLLALLVF
jgi:hypothetical protein